MDCVIRYYSVLVIRWRDLQQFNEMACCPSILVICWHYAPVAQSLSPLVSGFFLFDRGFVRTNIFLLVLDDETPLSGDSSVISPIPWMASIPLLSFCSLLKVSVPSLFDMLWLVAPSITSAPGPVGVVHPFHACMPLILCPCTRLFCLDYSVWCINDINCYGILFCCSFGIIECTRHF